MMDTPPEIAVVVPFFDEEEAIAPFFAELLPVLQSLQRSFEVLAIDDGSSDRTFERLAEIQANEKHVRVIRFRRNFGQSAALAAGFAETRAQVVVTMDGDLQNDPAEIPRLLEEIGRGADVVLSLIHI